MKKFLICGDLIEITKNINLLYSYHIQKKINIVGINANEEYYENMFNINYYTYSEIVNLKYDYIILVCNKEYYNEYKDYLLNINNNAKIINYKVFSIPNFDIDKYLDIYNDTPTIFTKNCAAGVIYNTLGLEFKSPIINLWLSDEDFLKFIKKPKKYLSYKIKENGFSLNIDNVEVPVCLVGDINLNCSHYKTHAEAIEAWNRRKKRVNYDNMIILFQTNNESLFEEFLKLPYKNKICLTQLSHSDPQIVTIDYHSEYSVEWLLLILDTFKYKIPYINVINLLHDKKIDLISKMNIKE